LQEPPANFKEESLDFVPEADNKMETEEEGASEMSSNLMPEVSYAAKDIAQKTNGEDLGIETANGNKSSIFSGETAVECCAEKETVIKESDLPSAHEDKDGYCENLYDSGIKSLTDTNKEKCENLSDSDIKSVTDTNKEKCENLSDSGIKSLTDTNKEKLPKEDTLIQDDSCPHKDELIPEVKSTVICDEKVMDQQGVTGDSLDSSNCVQKQKRGRPKNPAAEENLKAKKLKNKGAHNISPFNRIDLNNELESLAESFSDNEILKTKVNKLARRHKKKLEPKGTSVNGLGEDLVKKQRIRASRISSDISNEPGHEANEIQHGDLEEENTEEEKGGGNIAEKTLLEGVRADSGTDMQKMCNETKSSTSDIVAANGIEASSVLILPVES
jgi:hypothetical protein